MGVTVLASVNTAIKASFGKSKMRHVILFSNYISKVLELKHPTNRLELLKELARIFEAAVEANAKVENRMNYKTIPAMSTCFGSTSLQIQPNFGGDSSKVKVNGELLDMQDSSVIRAKLTKIYERGCTVLRVPENISCVVVFVDSVKRRRPR